MQPLFVRRSFCIAFGGGFIRITFFTFDAFFNLKIPVQNFNRLPTHLRDYADHVAELGRRVRFVVQDRQEGFGHAVLCAREWVGSALEEMRGRQGFIGTRIAGRRFDIGTPQAYVQTVVDYARD